MLSKILVVGIPVAFTVAMHAVGLSVLLRKMLKSQALLTSGFSNVAGRMISLTFWLVLIHLAEIAGWGLFYLWQDCLPDAESALYFSGVTYTTLGYGDVVLTPAWRLVAPIEALTGILM